MVLQLADADDGQAHLGAALLGAEAEAFFPGLPAADLRRCNATLAALRSRVAKLCDRDAPPSVFVLWACRPEEAEAGSRGVAYHVVGTQCEVLN